MVRLQALSIITESLLAPTSLGSRSDEIGFPDSLRERDFTLMYTFVMV